MGEGIFFRELDRLILGQDWYTGYKANIVTYTLAKLSQMVRSVERSIDFMKIWQAQTLPAALSEELLVIAKAVNQLLLDPPPGTTSNVSEWAKQPACWTAVSSAKLALSARIKPYLMDFRTEIGIERDAGKKQAVMNSIQAQTYVVEKGAKYWKSLREWNEAQRKLSPKEMGILDVACELPRRLPTEQQVPFLISAEKRAKADGFSGR